MAIAGSGAETAAGVSDDDIFAALSESPPQEEKRARKQAVKEMKKICREMKKKNKQVWKEETSKLKERGIAKDGQIRPGARVVPIG